MRSRVPDAKSAARRRGLQDKLLADGSINRELWLLANALAAVTFAMVSIGKPQRSRNRKPNRPAGDIPQRSKNRGSEASRTPGRQYPDKNKHASMQPNRGYCVEVTETAECQNDEL